MTEWCVFDALRDALADLTAFGFTVVRHGDEVCIDGHGVCVFIPARELIEDADPCGLVATRLGL